jgi:hypothetical protein
MASNLTCNEEHTQPRKKGGGIHHLKEADMVTAKLHLIMKKLDIERKEVMHINDSHVTCEELPSTIINMLTPDLLLPSLSFCRTPNCALCVADASYKDHDLIVDEDIH